DPARRGAIPRVGSDTVPRCRRHVAPYRKTEASVLGNIVIRSSLVRVSGPARFRALARGSGERGRVRAREERVDLVLQRAGEADERRCGRTCTLEQRPVAAQIGEAQVGEARLARPEELAAAAQLEILL